MKAGTRQVLKVLYVLSWIIFVGLCIVAGGYITNAFFAVVNPGIVKNLWHEADLSELLQYDTGHFLVEMLIMSVVAVLKALLFYQIISILHNKKINLHQPFSAALKQFTFRLSYTALLIGLFSWSGVNYTEWLIKLGVKMPDIRELRLDGADVWLFMSVILFVIAHIFKRGIEMQTENELTV
ncbi:DUF2975 domain-containing protein [Chitinophaga solisilvae]|uniref:DUF2975 domain-containing protein n=1 Tax=Chitinophaga solisilvae TaxID=1233460 RepID=UPI00136A8E5C|nr:DUF2975 domain-containing protein [Chitinophaga solisilvae]